MSRRDIALKYFDHAPAEVKSRIEQDIERYRKGTATLTFVDRDGKQLENVTVRARQKTHEFKFGANIFMLDEFENEDKNRIYREKFPMFNLATVPFYWSDLEPNEGHPRFAKDSPKVYRRPAPDLCVEYCKEQGIEPKCHCLNYDSFVPAWAHALPLDAYKRKLEKRFREIAERYAADIPSFEVTNETFYDTTPARTKFYSESDFVEWSFRMADRYFPANRLIINDFYVWEFDKGSGDRQPYYMQIERLGYRGITHLDSIGIQYHSFFPREREETNNANRYDPVRILDTFDRYARLGKKLQITEMTIPAYSAEAEDEDVQAELLKNIYTTFFSHPAMEAIIYWNLTDGYAAFAPQGDMTAGENKYHGGLLRFDLSEKPAYKMFKHLTQEVWHTDTTVSAPDGVISLRGFYGDYDLTVTYDGKTVPLTYLLSAGKRNIQKIVLP